MVKQVIGIDLGGTAIKLGRFDQTGRCLQSLTVPTPQPPEPQAVLLAMVDAIAILDPQHQSQAIGVGTPGPTDAEGRIARVAINLGWQNVPLADWLEAKTGKPTILANDANCAGLGEYWLGAGRKFQDLILLTLGTGVGGAVILDGKLFVGRDGTAGELGLITLDLAGHPCNSGNQGSLEQHVSVQAIRRRTGLEPEELGKRAVAGDEEAIAFWHTYGCELGAGLASLLYILTPEAVIIGGGVSASAHYFFPSILNELERRVLPSSRRGLQLLPAELGNQAGIVGAAKLAWQHLSTINPVQLAPATSPALMQQSELSYHMAMQMAQFKAGFLARTAHELRSPINSIISLHQLILSGLCDSPEEERDFLNQSLLSTQKALKLLDELIHISKAQHGTAQLQIQPLQLAAILKEVERLTHLQARNRSLRLEVELPDTTVYVLSDPYWLQQALLYLIDTSLAQMIEGTVRLTLHPSPQMGQMHIQIEDDRPPALWSEPVNLLQSPPVVQATVPHQMSSGLSLLMVQTILELMNGRLEVLSHTGGKDGAIATSNRTVIQCSIPLVVPEAD